jgi:5-methylcytosine-specific restriction endonuclease McrA
MTDPRPRLSDRDRKRLFRLHGRTCHICSQPIDGVHEAWDVEHVIPRSLIGRHADTDENMKPAHKACHREKSKDDANNLAEANRREDRHIGAHQARQPVPPGKPLPPGRPAKRATAPLSKQPLPRRALYTPEHRR